MQQKTTVYEWNNGVASIDGEENLLDFRSFNVMVMKALKSKGVIDHAICLADDPESDDFTVIIVTKIGE